MEIGGEIEKSIAYFGSNQFDHLGFEKQIKSSLNEVIHSSKHTLT